MKLSEIMMLYLSEETMLYEIADVVGLDNALKLISVFGGERIMIPSRESIKKGITEILIYAALAGDPTNVDTLQTLAFKFKLSEKEVRHKFNRIKEKFKKGAVSKLVFGNTTNIVVSDIEQYILELAY